MIAAPPEDAEYAGRFDLLTPLGARVEELIDELLRQAGLVVHRIGHRVKTHESAAAKLLSGTDKYGSYSDLHDFLGLRVITHLASDVDHVVAVLRGEFDVDDSRSFDKQTALDPDRFGYLSYHVVARLNPARVSLPEWARYKDIYFEVQIRSILQHAWAEIEHDLGYKSKSGIPAHVRRRFARLASLLELADLEFDGVTIEVQDHANHVQAVVEGGGSAAIDRDSVVALVASAGPVFDADSAIAAKIGAAVADEVSINYADERAEELAQVGYASTEDVVAAVRTDFDALVAFAANWFATPEDELDAGRVTDQYAVLPRGISLFYLYLHALLEAEVDSEHFAGVSHLERPEVFADFRRVHNRAFGKS